MNKLEGSKLESLLAEYANAEMDCVRATNRVRDAVDAVRGFVKAHVEIHEACAYQRGLMEGTKAPADVPTGTTCEELERQYPAAPTMAVPFTTNELEAGAMHYKHDAPVDCCQCGACCTARALKSIGTPSETQFGPPPGQYSGN